MKSSHDAMVDSFDKSDLKTAFDTRTDPNPGGRRQAAVRCARGTDGRLGGLGRLVRRYAGRYGAATEVVQARQGLSLPLRQAYGAAAEAKLALKAGIWCGGRGIIGATCGECAPETSRPTTILQSLLTNQNSLPILSCKRRDLKAGHRRGAAAAGDLLHPSGGLSRPLRPGLATSRARALAKRNRFADRPRQLDQIDPSLASRRREDGGLEGAPGEDGAVLSGTVHRAPPAARRVVSHRSNHGAGRQLGLRRTGAARLPRSLSIESRLATRSERHVGGSRRSVSCGRAELHLAPKW